MPGWGPYLFVSGCLLLVVAPILLIVGAPQVARIHGSLTWLTFVVLCVGAMLGGMNMLVQHRRFHRQQRGHRTRRLGIPTSDLIWGFGLLGSLATCTVAVIFFRWLR